MLKKKRKQGDAHTKFLIENLDEWREAVGGARGVADDGLVRVVGVGIDTHHICRDVSFAGRSDENLLGARFNVLARSLPVDKHPRPLDHQINPQLPEHRRMQIKDWLIIFRSDCTNWIKLAKCWGPKACLLPGEVGGVAVGDDLDDLAVDGDGGVGGGLNDGVEDAKGGVVLEEVGRLLDTSGVVDGNDVEGGVLAAVPAAEEVTAYASEAVDGHPHLRLCHPLPVSPAAPHLQVTLWVLSSIVPKFHNLHGRKGIITMKLSFLKCTGENPTCSS